MTTTANASMTNSIAMSSEAAAVGTTSAPAVVPSTAPSVNTDRIDAPHVDAERLRHGAILGGGAQDAAVIRPLQEKHQARPR